MFQHALFAAAAFILAASDTMAAPGAFPQGHDAQAAKSPKTRLDTPSGLPVPRFVSLKTRRSFCRAGPTFDHPVRLTYMRQGLPVMVVAETLDHWRKIRDPEGDECWMHKSQLSGAKTAMVIREGLVLRMRPAADSEEKAHLGRGLIARIEKEQDGWLKVSADGVRGWAPRDGFWGVFAAADAAN
mgnify:CR=1 FL=1